MFKTLLLCSVFLTFLLGRISYVQAATPTPGAGVMITLSEVSGCEDSEWVELYNDSSLPVDITGWKVEKKGDGATTWSSKLLTSDVATMSGKLYKQFSVGSSFLSNAGFSLRLKDATGEVLEENTFDKCPTATTTSWIKEGNDWKVTTTQTPNSANTFSAVATSTPSPTSIPAPVATPTPTASPRPSPTPSPTPTPTSASQPTTVTLSEIYACQADTAKEWVELYNSGTTSVTLTNWKVADDDGNEQPIASLTMSSKAFGVVEITKYVKGILTNSGDVVNLFDATGKKVDSYTYTSCTEGNSFAKMGSTWKETSNMTRGFANPTESDTASASGTLEGDGGADAGSILGTSVDSDVSSPEPSPSPTADPSSQTGSGSTLLALSFIGFGLILLLGVGGYLAWDPILKPKWKLLKAKYGKNS